MRNQADARRGESAGFGSARNLFLKSAEKVPWTAEIFTPTFSKTRPRMIDIVPPPPAFHPHFFGPRLYARISRREGRCPAIPFRFFEFGADIVTQFCEPLLWRHFLIPYLPKSFAQDHARSNCHIQ
jgi:hypothetical protein